MKEKELEEGQEVAASIWYLILEIDMLKSDAVRGLVENDLRPPLDAMLIKLLSALGVPEGDLSEAINSLGDGSSVADTLDEFGKK